MYKKMVILFALCAAMALNGHSQAGITAVPFLQIEPDSRAAGMGNTGVAIADNAAAVFWNPAGLAFQKGNQANITHSEWLPKFDADLFYDYLVARYDVKNAGMLGAHITYLNLGEQLRIDNQQNNLGRFNSYEFSVGVSYGFQLNTNWSLGTGIRYVRSSLFEGSIGSDQRSVSPGSSFGVDVATMYKSDSFSLAGRAATVNAGLNLSNIGPGLSYTESGQKDPLPTVLRFGAALTSALDDKAMHSLTVASDVSKIMARSNGQDTDGALQALFTSWSSFSTQNSQGQTTELSVLEQFMVSTGVEYWYNNLFALRSGYYFENPDNGDRRFLTLGAGIRYNYIGVDFSYVYTLEEEDPLANTTRFGLLLNF